MSLQWSGMVQKAARVRIACALAFGVVACGPRETAPQRGERVGESVSLLAATGPNVSSEIEVSERELVPSVGWRQRIAAGATSHLVAFQDVPTDFSAGTNLFGVRVGFDGAILDSAPFPISTESGEQGMPKLAFNGTDWLVTWRDGRAEFERDVYAARVAEDGTVRDPNGIAVATGMRDGPSSVASDGTDFLVTWNLDGIQAAIVRASGVVEPSFTVQAGTITNSAVAFNGTHYLVAYCELVADIAYFRAKRLTREGDAVGSSIDMGAGCSGVEVASGGTDWAVAYVSSASEITRRVVFADGTFGSPSTTTDTLGSSITWGGSSYWLAGESPGATSVRVTRLDRLGNELDSQVFDEQQGIHPQIAFGGESAFVTFSGENFVALGSRVDENLEWLDAPPLVLSRTESGQNQVRSAWGGSEHLVVWLDGGDPAIPYDNHVVARRARANGTPLGSRFEIPSMSQPRGHDVASNGNGYLVTWEVEMTPGLLATRVSPAGTLLDPSGIVVSPERPTTALEPAVASDGRDYYVVWRENNVARGVRVLADGSLPSGPVAISHSTVSSAPTLGWNGTSYLVAWSDDAGNVRASRVSSTGTVLDTSDLSIALASDLVAWQPQIASNGSDWFVLWLAGSFRQELRGTRVGADGAVKDRPAIDLDAANVQNHSVAWTGKEYLVAWSQYAGEDNYTLHGRRLSAEGRLIDSSAFPISTVPSMTFRDELDVDPQGTGSALITYSRSDTLRTRAKARTFTSDLSDGGEGGAGDGGAGAGGDSGGTGGSGGMDGGEAGEDAQGGNGRGGASGRGGAGSTSGEAGEAGDGSGSGTRRVVTEGCGCRVRAGGEERSGMAIAVAVMLSGVVLRRRKRIRPLRPAGRVPIHTRNRRF